MRIEEDSHGVISDHSAQETDPQEDFQVAQSEAEYFALFQELVEWRRERVASGLRPVVITSPVTDDEGTTFVRSIVAALNERPDISAIEANSATLRAMLAERD